MPPARASPNVAIHGQPHSMEVLEMIRLRLVLPVLAAAAGMLLNAGPVAASSGHTVSQTNNYHGSWTESGDVNPCTGDPMDVTFDGNMVQHVTYFPDSDEVWA